MNCERQPSPERESAGLHPALASHTSATCGLGSRGCGRWFWRNTRLPGSWPPRSCPRHSHPALGASRSSQQIWFARRLLPRRFSPTPPPTRPHSLPPSDTAERVLELAPPPYLGDAHLPAALSDHGEGADVQQSDPHPRFPAVLRTGDPGSRPVCARLDTYGSSGRSRQRLTPRSPPAIVREA